MELTGRLKLADAKPVKPVNSEADTTDIGNEVVSVAELDDVNPDLSGKEEVIMAETKIVPQMTPGGETVIDDQVIGAIAGTAAQEIEGVASLGTSSVRRAIAERLGGERRSRGVGVVAGHREAILDLEINVIYGASIPDVVNQVRENVAGRVLDMCGLVTKEININVVGIEFAYGHPSRFGRVE